MGVGKIIFCIVTMLMAVYVVTGFMVDSVRELKRASWRNARRRVPNILSGRRLEDGNIRVLASMECGSVEIVEFSIGDGKFSKDGVEAWRPLPPVYRNIFKKLHRGKRR